MRDIKTLEELFRHMAWADALVWGAVLASSDAREDARLREKLTHLHVVQHAFLLHWQGRADEFREETFDDASALAEWGAGREAALRAHVASVSEDDLARGSVVPWASMVEKRIGRAPGETTLGETMLQVVLHSTYHRGQVNARLREIGAEPPLTDYIAWVWLGRPEPRWPELATAG